MRMPTSNAPPGTHVPGVAAQGMPTRQGQVHHARVCAMRKRKEGRIKAWQTDKAVRWRTEGRQRNLPDSKHIGGSLWELHRQRAGCA